MKYRAVANGNILDESDVPEGLIAAGIYEPVEESGAVERAEDPMPPTPAEPAAPPPATSRVAPLTTADTGPLHTAANTEPPRSRGRPGKRRRG